MPTPLKSLEHRWRRALLAAGHRPFAGQVVSRSQDVLNLPEAPRILLIRLERIGDVLVSLPVLRLLQARYPKGRIDLLVSRANYAVRDVVAPFVSSVWCYEKTLGSALRLLRALRRTRYDVVVDLLDHPSTTAQLVSRWCGAPARVGLLHAESGVYTHAAPVLDRATVHPVERFAQLLLPFGIDPATHSLDLEFPLEGADIEGARRTLGPAVPPLRFGVNLSGRVAGRHWGTDNYIAIIRHLTARDPRFAVYVCGSPRDAPEVEHVARTSGARAVPASSSLREFAAILHQFDLLLTPDTAAVHLAAAGKVPTVAMYHSIPGVAPWLPYNTPHRAVADPGGIPAIPLARVVVALDDLVRERFGPAT
jgi:ADP-heptose:LPS heptosyltransferase